MYEKNLILLFFALTLFSCSKDESDKVSGAIVVNIKLIPPKNLPNNVDYNVDITPEGGDTYISNINWDKTTNYDSKTVKLKSSDVIYGNYLVKVSLYYPTTNNTYTYYKNILIQVLPNEESKIDIEF